jgi:putative phage-type endonuclease
MIQGSPEWFAARRGNVGASSVYKVMAKGEGKVRKKYMIDLLVERLGGEVESFTSAAMQRGTELEPIARSAYEVATGQMVAECGFIIHPTIARFGASPDGLVGDRGLLEIKCPDTATHIDTLRSKKPAGQYVWQMAAQMACTDRDWCDFVSFDDRLPEHLQMVMIRVERDEKRETEMLAEIQKFLNELDSLYQELTT